MSVPNNPGIRGIAWYTRAAGKLASHARTAGRTHGQLAEMQRLDQTDTMADASAACLVGVARLDITPPVGIYSRMWGAALHDCATAVHRPLLATGLAIVADGSGPESVQLILALDLCVLGMAEMEEVIVAVMEATGLTRREQLVVTMSHTHAAPGILSREPTLTSLPGGHLIAPYFETVKAGCIEVGKQAVAAQRPAWVAFGHGRCNLAQVTLLPPPPRAPPFFLCRQETSSPS